MRSILGNNSGMGLRPSTSPIDVSSDELTQTQTLLFYAEHFSPEGVFFF